MHSPRCTLTNTYTNTHYTDHFTLYPRCTSLWGAHSHQTPLSRLQITPFLTLSNTLFSFRHTQTPSSLSLTRQSSQTHADPRRHTPKTTDLLPHTIPATTPPWLARSTPQHHEAPPPPLQHTWGPGGTQAPRTLVPAANTEGALPGSTARGRRWEGLKGGKDEGRKGREGRGRGRRRKGGWGGEGRRGERGEGGEEGRGRGRG